MATHGASGGTDPTASTLTAYRLTTTAALPLGCRRRQASAAAWATAVRSAASPTQPGSVAPDSLPVRGASACTTSTSTSSTRSDRVGRGGGHKDLGSAVSVRPALPSMGPMVA
jgi:hypothetical protein